MIALVLKVDLGQGEEMVCQGEVAATWRRTIENLYCASGHGRTGVISGASVLRGGGGKVLCCVKQQIGDKADPTDDNGPAGGL
jgi:hypothetical protein